MKYHLNAETGEVGTCRASSGKCPFGGDEVHFTNAQDAGRAFETMMGSSFGAASKVSVEEVEAVRSEARALAAQFLDDPDWLPPVDDPSKPDGIDEEKGYIDSLEAFKDPALARGNCSVVADAVQEFTEGEYEVIEEEVGGPHLNIHVANVYTDRAGRKWVIDYTYSQIDPQAEWPHVAPLDEWRQSVHEAGYRSPESLDKEFETVEDESYKIAHQPSPDGAMGHDVEAMYPDFYAHPEWYATGDAASDRETLAVVRAMRNNPEAEVTIYRALPDVKYGIRPGNWVSLSRSYVESHGADSGEDGSDWPIVELRVRAKDIRTPGDSINEWGYYPSE